MVDANQVLWIWADDMTGLVHAEGSVFSPRAFVK